MQNNTIDELQLLIIKTMKDQNKTEFQNLLNDFHPYDLAELYSGFPEKHRVKFTSWLSEKQLAILIQELDFTLQVDVLQRIGAQRTAKVMDLMENDDLADLLSQYSVNEVEQFLQTMEKEESQTVQQLMNYDPETAGGIMTNRYVWIRSYYTVREAIDKIKSFAKFAENIYYLYVLDEDKRLTGVVSYRDLLLADLQDSIESIMYNRVISVPVDMDQEEVARMMERYDFIAIPVVDFEQRLVGIITIDDIIDVMIYEANEDIGKLSAAGKGIDFNTSAWVSSLRRLPWLILLLLLGLLSGSIMAAFESTLNSVVALAFFMPMILGMTGNTGTQSLAIVVRGLANDGIDHSTVIKLILREIGVGVMIGIVCGLLVSSATYLWMADAQLSLVIGFSLLVTLVIGTFAGTVIPLILYKLQIDPAIASGPLITTLNDIFSLSIYFGLATAFLTQL